MKTEQFNVRLSEELIEDLGIVSNLLKVNRSEWIKTKLAEEIHKEKTRLLMELSTLYAKGMITTREIEQRVGKDIVEEMKFIKQKALSSIKKGKIHGKKEKQIHS